MWRAKEENSVPFRALILSRYRWKRSNWKRVERSENGVGVTTTSGIRRSDGTVDLWRNWQRERMSPRNGTGEIIGSTCRFRSCSNFFPPFASLSLSRALQKHSSNRYIAIYDCLTLCHRQTLVLYHLPVIHLRSIIFEWKGIAKIKNNRSNDI